MFERNQSLNPFGTGRGLSTRKKITMPEKIWGLNPFGTGRGLSTVYENKIVNVGQSQSLWNRAGSFDRFTVNNNDFSTRLNPFGTGRGLSTARVVWSLGG